MNISKIIGKSVNTGMKHQSWRHVQKITALNHDKLLVAKRGDFLFSEDIIQEVKQIKEKSAEEDILCELFDIYKNSVNETSYNCDELMRMAYLIGYLCKYDHPIVNKFDFGMIGNYLNYIALNVNIIQVI